MPRVLAAAAQRRRSSSVRQGQRFERCTHAGHALMQPAGADQPAFASWFVQRCGLSRRIEVTTYGFAALLQWLRGVMQQARRKLVP